MTATTSPITVEVIATNPPQVCATYPDGKMEVMYKSEWDKQDQ